MKTIKYKKVMISMPEDLWISFKNTCHENYKSASSVIRELIVIWSAENDKKSKRKRTKIS